MIRDATIADIPRLMEMGHRFISETPYKDHLKENPEQMKSLASHLITSQAGSILLAEKDGQLIGMLGIALFPHHLSGESMAGEVFWWVEPEHRRSRISIDLMKQAEKVAAKLGAKKMQMVAPTERIGKLYEHFGYVLVESTYQRELAWQ